MRATRRALGWGCAASLAACSSPLPVEIPAASKVGAAAVVLHGDSFDGRIFASEDGVLPPLTLAEGDRLEARYYGCGLEELELPSGWSPANSCGLPSDLGMVIVHRGGHLEPAAESLARTCDRCETDPLRPRRVVSFAPTAGNDQRVSAAIPLNAEQVLLSEFHEPSGDHVLRLVGGDGTVQEIEPEYSAPPIRRLFGGFWQRPDGSLWVATPLQIWVGRLSGSRLLLELSKDNAEGLTGYASSFYADPGATEPVWLLGGYSSIWLYRGGTWSLSVPARVAGPGERPTGLAPIGDGLLVGIGVGRVERDKNNQTYTSSVWILDRRAPTNPPREIRFARAQEEEARSAFGRGRPGDPAYLGSLDGRLRPLYERGPSEGASYPVGIQTVTGDEDRLFLGFNLGGGLTQVFPEQQSGPCATDQMLREVGFLFRLGDRLISVAEAGGEVAFFDITHRHRCTLAAQP